MTEQTKIVLHLSLSKSITPTTLHALLERVPLHAWSDFYAYQSPDFEQFKIDADAAVLIAAAVRDTRALDREQELLSKHDIQLMTLLDDDYPAMLRAIHRPPPVLYIKGKPIGNQKLLAVIGSRNADEYAQRALNVIIPPLLRNNWVIISGGALGADSMAHRVVLEHQGTTMAVLGSGLLRPSPATHQRLFEQIVAASGTIISTFPLETEPRPTQFPARNRIISGLSKGVFVLQAGEKSGTNITAQCALDQSREVFALPGSFDHPLSIGCHKLIQQGAKLVTTAQDILQEFGETAESKLIYPAIKQQLAIHDSAPDDDSMDIKTRIVYLCKQPMSIDELLIKTSLSLPQLTEYLFDLQLDGLISQHFSGTWQQP